MKHMIPLPFSPLQSAPLQWRRRIALTGVLSAVLLLLLATITATASTKPDRYPHPKRFKERVELFVAQDKEAPPESGGIVFAGSAAITRWNKLLPAHFEGYNVIGRGFGGATIADNTHYVQQTILPHRPRQVVFYGGDADIALGRSPEGVLADFAAFTEAIHSEQPGIPILYLSIKPALRQQALQAQFTKANALIHDYCARNAQLVYADISPALLGKDGQPLPAYYTKDGLHLSPEGYKAVATLITPLLLPEPEKPQEPATTADNTDKTDTPKPDKKADKQAEKKAAKKSAK